MLFSLNEHPNTSSTPTWRSPVLRTWPPLPSILRIPQVFSRNLKLRTHPRRYPSLIAYFGRVSPLVDEISAPDALPWGESGICTVTVRWNTEVPDRPFVELIRIDGFTWNP